MTTPGPVIHPGEGDGYCRETTLSDALHLVTDHGHVHLGFPPGVTIDVPDFPRNINPRLLPHDEELRAGDVYVFPVSSLLGRLAGLPGGVPPGAATALEELGLAVASDVVAAVGFVPLSWQVPNLKGSPVSKAAHVRMVFSGVFGTVAAPYEIWSWGINAAAGGPTDQAGLDAAATTLKNTWLAHIKAVTTQNIVLTQTLYADVDSAGHVQRFPDGSYKQGKKTWAEPGAMAVQGQLPLQTALVVSYSTPRPGATGRGRSYLPFQVSQTIGEDFRIGENFCAAVAAAATAMVTDLNAIGGRCSVVSNGSKKEPSAVGAVSPITRVRVGRVPDTMRSRRDGLAEGYISGAAIG